MVAAAAAVVTAAVTVVAAAAQRAARELAVIAALPVTGRSPLCGAGRPRQPLWPMINLATSAVINDDTAHLDAARYLLVR